MLGIPRTMKPILLSSLCVAALAILPVSLVAADASENWTGHCAKCHGPDGKGKTKMGTKLKIRDLTDPEIQKQLNDDQTFVAIKDGIMDEKGGKLNMPAFKEKLSDEEITAMVSHVRSMCRQ